MKTSTLLTVVAVLLCIVSCKTASYFETPNAVKNITATVFLLNGDSINGNITITTNYVSGGILKVYPNNSNAVKIRLNEIEGYKAGNNYYSLKEIRGGFTKGTTQSFMKKLSTEGDNISLYESTVKQAMFDKNKPSNTVSKKYYIKLPDERSNIVYSVKDIKSLEQFTRNSRQTNSETVLKFGLSETMQLNISEKDLKVLSPFLLP